MKPSTLEGGQSARTIISQGMFQFINSFVAKQNEFLWKTALAEICVDGNGRVSTNSGSDVRKWDQPLTT